MGCPGWNGCQCYAILTQGPICPPIIPLGSATPHFLVRKQSINSMAWVYLDSFKMQVPSALCSCWAFGFYPGKATQPGFRLCWRRFLWESFMDLYCQWVELKKTFLDGSPLKLMVADHSLKIKGCWGCPAPSQLDKQGRPIT